MNDDNGESPEEASEIDWDSLPDLIPSEQVAALLNVKPGTLTRYHQDDRAILAPPVGKEGRSAMYRKADVRDFHERRQIADTPERRLVARVDVLEKNLASALARIAALEAA